MRKELSVKYVGLKERREKMRPGGRRQLKKNSKKAVFKGWGKRKMDQ